MDNPILYGHNPHSNIVCVSKTDENKMRVFVRKDNEITYQDFDFFPFFFLSDDNYLQNFDRKYWIKLLDGENFYRYIVAFPRLPDMWDCIRHIINNYNQNSEKKINTYSDLPILYLRPDPISQFLTQSGITLFKSMNFEDLKRIQIHIETYKKPGKKISKPEHPDDRILYIVLKDSSGEEHIIGKKEKSEKEIIEELSNFICKQDPDIIEGHFLQHHILPYIIKRCELNSCEFNIGRNNTPIKISELQISLPDGSTESTTYSVQGRQLIDTYSLIKYHDPTKRNIISYNLKSAAEYFGYDESTDADSDITSSRENESTNRLIFSKENLNRVKHITDILLPGLFLESQIFPYNLENLPNIVNASKIESLLIREYVRQKHSIPKPQSPKPTSGGYTNIFLRGIVGPIIYIDVESMYPTIMINENINPKPDKLFVFHSALKELTRLRLNLKKKFKEGDHNNKFYYLHNIFKIIINTFYGYLGYNRALFNDYDQADKVALVGQKIIKQLIDTIQIKGGKVILVDTDGIFFKPPLYITNDIEEQNFIDEIKKHISDGFSIVVEGKFKKMLSYKKKNYATFDYDKKIQIKGSALISKSLERFGVNFLHLCIDRILNDDFKGMHDLYVQISKDISEHKWQVQDFMRVETLKDTIERYQKETETGERNKSAVYELAIQSEERLKIGDRIAYYITGDDANVKSYQNCKLAEKWDSNFPDENTAFYLKRLEEYTKKFEDFFSEEDFKKIFSLEEQFEFSYDDITYKNIEPTEEQKSDDVEEELKKGSPREDYSIWLSEE